MINCSHIFHEFAYSDFTLIAEIGKANPPCFDNLLNIHMNRIIDREGRRNLAQLVVFAYIISNNSQYKFEKKGAYHMAVFGICQFFGRYFGSLNKKWSVFGIFVIKR